MASYLRVCEFSTNSNFCSPFSLNLPVMDLSASLGSFLDFTVLTRSGMSQPLSFFMEEMNLLCCIYRKMLSALASSSILLLRLVLDLVKDSH